MMMYLYPASIATTLLLTCCYICLTTADTVSQEAPVKSIDHQHRSLIIGGHDARKGRYPYFATFDHFGGGVLIAPDIILTAGHCNPPKKQHVKVRLDHYRFQSNNLYREPDDDETYSIVEKRRHPGFYTVSWDAAVNDFNLFKIDGFSKVKPVKLNRNPNLPRTGTMVTVIGMGSTKANPRKYDKSAATTLQEVELQVISHAQCEASHDPKRPYTTYKRRIFDDQMVCTIGGPHNEKDACAYDSGSPLLLTPRNNHQPEDLVVGLVSWGEQCSDPYFPAVNARVAYAFDWISKTVCELSDAHPSELKDFNCGSKTSRWSHHQDESSSSSSKSSSRSSSRSSYWMDNLMGDHNYFESSLGHYFVLGGSLVIVILGVLLGVMVVTNPTMFPVTLATGSEHDPLQPATQTTYDTL